MIGTFAFAPTPVAGELLGSWVHRVAIGHNVSGSAFLQTNVADIDWHAPEELLHWLSRGSGQSIATLRSMTLSNSIGSARRSDFALSSGYSFPGCHAFCPSCGAQDRRVHGEVVVRRENAGRWRVACRSHGVLLDGAEHEDALTPIVSRGRIVRDGRFPDWPGIEAPAFVMAFEDAVSAAEAGRAPAPYWSVNTPGDFLRIAEIIASFALVREQGHLLECAAAALSGRRNGWAMGADLFDLSLIERATTPSRICALLATALLMLSPCGAAELKVDEWCRVQSMNSFRRGPITAWEAAAAPWHWAVMDKIHQFVSDWPPEVRARTQAIAAHRSVSKREPHGR